MRVSPQLRNKIRQIIENYHTQLNSSPLKRERDFIKNTVDFFGNSSASHGYESFFSRSKIMDKTPIVQFFHNTACNNPGKTEIGDILLVSKLIRYGRLVEKRAIVIQSKFSLAAQMHWSSINTAQFYLVSVWPPFLRIKPKPLTGYNFHPQSLMWGTYAFVGPNATNYPIYQSPSRIFNQIPHLFSQKTFTFSPIRLYGLDMAPCFLMRLILCRIGENLLTNPNINSFVDELYRMTDLAPDPPNEFYWDADDNEEPPRGFGVVEFTISMERE